MANANGKQDLIVNILSADKRYEVANYKNVTMPTNFDVRPAVKTRFAEFYAGLFDKTLEANPGAVVTEYAWTAQPQLKCDPCPDQVPVDGDVMTLGGDIVGGRITTGNYVLTRLHARYGRGDMKDDLRFREAKPITGGREMWAQGGIEHGAVPSAQNYFQARYAIRYWWTGPIKCQNPQRGIWGGPPDGRYQQAIAASKLAFAPRGQISVAQLVKRDLPEIGLKKVEPPAPPAPGPTGGFAKPPGKGAMIGLGLTAALAALGAGMAASRRCPRRWLRAARGRRPYNGGMGPAFTADARALAASGDLEPWLARILDDAVRSRLRRALAIDRRLWTLDPQSLASCLLARTRGDHEARGPARRLATRARGAWRAVGRGAAPAAGARGPASPSPQRRRHRDGAGTYRVAFETDDVVTLRYLAPHDQLRWTWRHGKTTIERCAEPSEPAAPAGFPRFQRARLGRDVPGPVTGRRAGSAAGTGGGLGLRQALGGWHPRDRVRHLR